MELVPMHDSARQELDAQASIDDSGALEVRLDLPADVDEREVLESVRIECA